MSRYHLKVSGVVQGVGFRPFIYQIATSNSLTGFVCNTSGYVDIEVEGTKQNLDNFVNDIRNKLPNAAYIRTLDIATIDDKHDSEFKITESVRHENEYQLISPDLATCSECVKEIFDSNDRRFHYAFTNCTNCGPRFTIIDDIPYDRPLTTMRDFKMCPLCHKEYTDPLDRRFHAQPNACPVCGPQLELIDNHGNAISGDVIDNANNLIRNDNILAIKGLGGFLLCCNALSDTACTNLRIRKHRPIKPFALMFKNLEAANEYCLINEAEKELLLSHAAPIVLLKLKENVKLSKFVAPGLSELGVMLPYTPLHHLLLNRTDLPLVMTSGNITEEPIVNKNEEALKELGNIADYLILHNRAISRRYDDSVMAVYAGEKRTIRRARGYAPFPITLPTESKEILACGSDLKNTFTLTRDNNAFVSQHIGDMENEKAYDNFTSTITDYKRIFRINPEFIACDMHPNYFSANYARELAKEQNLPIYEIQHHHAHIVSCMAENKLNRTVLGVALDGTGYGTDQKIWGFEFLKSSYSDFERLLHLEYLPLPGGDSAVKNPIKIAYAYLKKLYGSIPAEFDVFNEINDFEKQILDKQLEKNLNVVDTSSCGRLFDAVSALLQLCTHTSYEAEAAIKLEECAKKSRNKVLSPYNYETTNDEIKVKPIFDGILADLNSNSDFSDIAYRFHLTIRDIVVYNSKLLLKNNNLNDVCLSGGVFQNKLLLEMILRKFEEEGINVYTNVELPSNDGCISYGQAVICNELIRGDK